VHGTGTSHLYTFVGTTAAADDRAPNPDDGRDDGPRKGPDNGPERPEVRAVPLDELSVGYSPRLVRVDDDHVALLMEVLERLPPIVVNEATMTVIDGVHRAEAFRRAGRSEIRAVLYSGDETGALVLAVQANVRHGKPLSRVERQAAAVGLLRRCPDRSDRWAGEVCGLSHSTVARLRQAAQAADRTARTGRDGRRRPVDPAPGREAVADALSSGRATSVRQAAAAAGVAASTAQRVAAGLREEQRSMDGLPSPAPPPGQFLRARTDPASASRPGRPEIGSWLEKTAVDTQDLHLYLDSVPLDRIHEVVDECRRRAHTWAEMADTLEEQAKARRPGPG
jgi:ParB-like chromosome segregation protein Spo0J